MDGKMAVTQRGDSLDSNNKQGVFHNTPDTGRELPPVTTAPPFTDLNHHLQFKTISQPDRRYQSQEHFKDSRQVNHHLFKALSAQLIPHEDAVPFSDVASGTFSVHATKLTAGNLERSGAAGETQRQSSDGLSTESLTTSIMPTSAPPPCHTVPQEQSGQPHGATTQKTEGVTTLVMREDKISKTIERHKVPATDATALTLSVSGDQDDETTTTTIFTTTIITTIQTPGNTTCTMMSQQTIINMPL